MIAGLALALHALQGAVVAPPITVRQANGSADTVAVIVDARDGGEQVAAHNVARALGGAVARPSAARVRLRVGARTFEFTDQVPFVASGNEIFPLGSAPQIGSNRVLLPAQFVADVLPRAVTGYAFSAADRELRAFPTVARRPSRDARVATPSPRAEVTAEVPVPRAATELPTSLARRRIVVDAGHGGPDGGMQASLAGGIVVTEKDVTLGVARALQNILRERGIGVVMTRSRDTLIALADRGRIAKQRQGDLFVSIHVNAANPAWRDAAAARGFETYFLAEARTEDARRLEQLENESERFETGGPARGDPLSFIITDMAQNEHLRESSELATRIQRRLARTHPGPSRGVKQAGFKVLVTAFMPAVLIEIGFGTNAADAAYITGARGQRALAEAIADAAVDYLADYDRRAAPGGGGTP